LKGVTSGDSVRDRSDARLARTVVCRGRTCGGTARGPASTAAPAARRGAGGRVEFRTAADLAALLGRLPADTPVRIEDGFREDPRVDTYDGRERLVYAAWQQESPSGSEPDSPAAVMLGAFYALADPPVPAATVAVSPYDRAIEAVHAADHDTLFTAFRELLRFIAGHVDGIDDAHLFEAIEDNPRLAARAELEAQLLREAADRLDTLHDRIGAHLDAPAGDGPGR
jgi:hypothetical protein